MAYYSSMNISLPKQSTPKTIRKVAVLSKDRVPLDNTGTIAVGASELSLGEFLDYIEHAPPKKIYLNHMVIESPDEESTSLDIDRAASFTVAYDGFMDVEFFMAQSRPIRMTIRQSAMTFMELESNGDVLPTITISCALLPESEQARLAVLAGVYSDQGKLRDRTAASNLLKEYIAKSAFCPVRYGGTRHV